MEGNDVVSSVASSGGLVLREHHLRYLPVLGVDEEMLEHRFAAGCSTARCDGECCREGVWLDVGERDRILANVKAVLPHMDASQEHDPSRWFGNGTEPDADFPSGQAAWTEVVDERCVFLNAQRRCVLHIAEAAVPGLKPFFCRAFPIALDHGKLCFDDGHCPAASRCCAPARRGTLTVFDAYGWELEFVLGAAGVDELRRLVAARAPEARGTPRPSS